MVYQSIDEIPFSSSSNSSHGSICTPSGMTQMKGEMLMVYVEAFPLKL
jgi:hypothetical protein